MKRYIINAVMGIGMGVVYTRGIYIVSVIALTIFCVLESYLARNQANHQNNFDLINIAGFCFFFFILLLGIIKNKLNFIEIIVCVFMSFDFLSIWVVIVHIIECKLLEDNKRKNKN